MYIMIACFRISDEVVPLQVCDDESHRRWGSCSQPYRYHSHMRQL